MDTFFCPIGVCVRGVPLYCVLLSLAAGSGSGLGLGGSSDDVTDGNITASDVDCDSERVSIAITIALVSGTIMVRLIEPLRPGYHFKPLFFSLPWLIFALFPPLSPPSILSHLTLAFPPTFLLSFFSSSFSIPSSLLFLLFLLTPSLPSLLLLFHLFPSLPPSPSLPTADNGCAPIRVHHHLPLGVPRIRLHHGRCSSRLHFTTHSHSWHQ